MLAALRAKKGANFHFGLVCSSWIALSRFSSGRHPLSPLGDRSLEWVESANVMVSRRVGSKYRLHQNFNLSWQVLIIPVQVCDHLLPPHGPRCSLVAGAARVFDYIPSRTISTDVSKGKSYLPHSSLIAVHLIS